MTIAVQPTLPNTPAKARTRVERDPEATAEFQRVAKVVIDMRQRRDPELTSYIAAHAFGMTAEELAEANLPPCPDL